MRMEALNAEAAGAGPLTEARRGDGQNIADGWKDDEQASANPVCILKILQ